MKFFKNIFVLLILVITLTGCGNFVEIDENKEISGEISLQQHILLASEAILAGQGFNNELDDYTDTIFDEELDAIINFGQGSVITFNLPDDVYGEYNIYINLSKTPTGIGTTPLSFSINDGEKYTPSIPLLPANSELSDLYDMGIFLLKENVGLRAGDKITIFGKAGFEKVDDGKMKSHMPIIGNLVLAPVSEDIYVGYNGGSLIQAEDKDESDILSGLNIAWLGSSVTYGYASGGYSMADEIANNHSATNSYKYAISGTTLVNNSDSSYVARMQDIDKNMDLDLFVVQLSTNDATSVQPLGGISESLNIQDFDDTTIVGAIETIISYVNEVWNCPIVFYTGTYFYSDSFKEGSILYGEMVELLYDIKEKWGINIIDLYNNEDMLSVYETDEYNQYMSDPIHPTREGYVKWWYPQFEEALKSIF